MASPIKLGARLIGVGLYFFSVRSSVPMTIALVCLVCFMAFNALRLFQVPTTEPDNTGGGGGGGENCRLQYMGKLQHAVFTLSYRKQTKTWTLFRLLEVKLIPHSGKPEQRSGRDSWFDLDNENTKMSGGYILHFTPAFCY